MSRMTEMMHDISFKKENEDIRFQLSVRLSHCDSIVGSSFRLEKFLESAIDSLSSSHEMIFDKEFDSSGELDHVQALKVTLFQRKQYNVLIFLSNRR